MDLSPSVLARRVDILAALGAGHTQAEAAKIVGCSTRTVQRIVALDRLRAAVPPGQLPEAIRAALAEETNRRRRARLLHDLAALAFTEARALRRSLRANRARRRGHASAEPDGELPPVVGRVGDWVVGGLDDSPESLEKIQAAAAWAIEKLRSTK